MLRRLIATSLLVALSLTASAQPWRRFFSSFYDPQAITTNPPRYLIPSKDGGAYAVAAALTKYASDGKQEWTTRYLPIDPIGVHEGTNAVYVIGSATRRFYGQQDFLLEKVDLDLTPF
jgi:hypothetical protein